MKTTKDCWKKLADCPKALANGRKLLPNNTQHRWAQHVASVCMEPQQCWYLLVLVAYSLKPVKLLGQCKRTQHCWPKTPNNTQQCCDLLRPFACASRPGDANADARVKKTWSGHWHRKLSFFLRLCQHPLVFFTLAAFAYVVWKSDRVPRHNTNVVRLPNFGLRPWVSHHRSSDYWMFAEWMGTNYSSGTAQPATVWKGTILYLDWPEYKRKA